MKQNVARELRLLHTMGGPWVGQTLYVAAKLGLADHLRDGPLPVTELAVRTGTHEAMLYRFCRALAALDVLTAEPARRFGLGRLGPPLFSDAGSGLRYTFILHGEEVFLAWSDVLHTVRTGEPAFNHVFGTPYWEYLASHSTANEIFNRAMGRADEAPAVLAECDLSDCRLIVDLGGGIGTVLGALLQRYPAARGLLFDRPACVEQAPASLARLGVQDRVEVRAGDFFAGVPARGDAYLLCRVLHNWDDETALRLLRGVRQAMAGHARLVVVDHLLPETGGRYPGLLADLHMAVVLGAGERTEPELRDLLRRAGFTVRTVLRGNPPSDPRAQSMVEAVPTEAVPE